MSSDTKEQPKKVTRFNFIAIAAAIVVATCLYDTRSKPAEYGMNSAKPYVTTSQKIKPNEYGMKPYTFSYKFTGLIALNTTTTLPYGVALPYTPSNVLCSVNTPGVNLVLSTFNFTNTSTAVNNMVAVPINTQVTCTCEPPNN